MDIKAFLEQAVRAERGIDALAARRARCLELEALAGALEAEAARAELGALEAELGARLAAYPGLVRRVEARLDSLEDPRQREVMRMRYLNGWSWKQVGSRTGLSRTRLHDIHAAAMDALKEVK